MKLFGNRATEALETVVFEPVTEIGVSEIPGVADVIRDNYAQRLADETVASWGAYVLRDAAGISPADIFSMIVPDFTPGVAEIEGRGGRIHTDMGPQEQAADVTVHKTFAGIADATIFVDADISRWYRQKGHGKQVNRVTRQLAERGEQSVERPVVTGVRRALRTRLVSGDVLLFDHTQPHGFRGSTDRYSVAYF